ncbi:MAG: hypothetical protein NWE93_07865 [Candidatus Bathyarchaeota archaeon]|nr:hypothetical protein [Candidatus Bathyarchaeota archaeon]
MRIKDIYLQAISLTMIVVFCLSISTIGKTQGEPQAYTNSYLLLNHPGGNVGYQLNITIPYTVIQTYSMQSHTVYSSHDFPKYVTPYTLKPIADRLWQIYNNTEDFTNGVLMLVHQITYEETEEGKYPVETLAAGKGDCDLFAYIAASILKAGEVPTVLLYYKDQQHMEIGVDLGAEPADARSSVHSVTFENASYYVAECTGSKWRDGWRVGECPSQYQNVTVQVVSLEKVEDTSAGQVSASLRELDASSLSLDVSSGFIVENGKVTLSGQILPNTAGENVTLQANVNNGGWSTIGTVETGKDGDFSFSWAPGLGAFDVQASWVGNRELNGATSQKSSILVLPYYLIALIFTAVLAVAMLAVTVVVTRRRRAHALGLPNQSAESQV